MKMAVQTNIRKYATALSYIILQSKSQIFGNKLVRFFICTFLLLHGFKKVFSIVIAIMSIFCCFEQDV